MITTTRTDVEGGINTGGQRLLLARITDADGWLFVSNQTPMMNDEVVGNGIVGQSHQTIKNVFVILAEAGCRPEYVVRYGVWLDDPCGFQSSNKAFKECFGANPPIRACAVSSMVIDCKVKVDRMTYKKP